jgi:hypothetical protein
MVEIASAYEEVKLRVSGAIYNRHIQMPPEKLSDVKQLTDRLLTIVQNFSDRHGFQRNVIVGSLELAKMEFFRRLVVPMNEASLIENGDITLPERVSPKVAFLREGGGDDL